MPLNVRKVSINLAVICFFSLSIFTSLCGLPPFICCKRAIIGALIVYAAANITIRLINMILIDAMIIEKTERLGGSDNQNNKRRDRAGR